MKKLLTISLLAFLGTTMTNSVYSSEHSKHKDAHKKEEHKGGFIRKMNLNVHKVSEVKAHLAKEKGVPVKNVEIHSKVGGSVLPDEHTLDLKKTDKEAVVVYTK